MLRPQCKLSRKLRIDNCTVSHINDSQDSEKCKDAEGSAQGIIYIKYRANVPVSIRCGKRRLSPKPLPFNLTCTACRKHTYDHLVETEVFSCYASDYWTEDGVKHLLSGLRKTITPVMSCAILAFVAKYVGHVKVLVKAVGSACAQRRSQDSNRHH